MTRRIGRRVSEASPVSVARSRCAARMPLNSRMVVPELLAVERTGRFGQAAHTASDDLVGRGPGGPNGLPSTPRHASVAAQSAPGEYPRICDVPSASAASIA